MQGRDPPPPSPTLVYESNDIRLKWRIALTPMFIGETEFEKKIQYVYSQLLNEPLKQEVIIIFKMTDMTDLIPC